MISRYIYGAGRYGRFMLDFFKKHNIEICGFIHSDNTEGIIEQLPVLPFDKIKNEKEKLEIFVAVSDEAVCKDLVKKIRTEIPQCIVYNSFSFVFDNWYSTQETIEEYGKHICNVCGSRNDFLPGGSKNIFFELKTILK